MNVHLYGVNRMAEYFLQDGQIISVQRGHFSLLKLRREPAHGDGEERKPKSTSLSHPDQKPWL